jgi:RNA ligase (TIGR02306 family)
MIATTPARKLASIQRIKALEPIPNADAIEKATVLGWQLVVKRGEFRVGDLCVYCEIDSVTPERPEFEFLRPRGFVIKTVRLRGQISQGICFPLSILPPGTEIVEGADVTEALGIIKYEPPVPAQFAGMMKGPFPSFIPKTDEPRVQVLEGVLDRHRGAVFYAGEKLDGASITCYLRDGEFGVCSRQIDLKESRENLYWQAARRFEIEERLRRWGGNVAVQGELVGEGIQKNRLGLKGVRFFAFSLFDIDRYAFLDYADFVATARELALPTVPIVADDFVLTETTGVQELVAYAVGRSALNEAVWREGLVFRPLVETIDLELGRLSFKAINPEYLLKYGE